MPSFQPHGIEEGKIFLEIHFSSSGASIASGWAQEKKETQSEREFLHDDAAQKEVSKNRFLCRSLLWWVMLL